jgi:hypothetical protein
MQMIAYYIISTLHLVAYRGENIEILGKCNATNIENLGKIITINFEEI